MGIGLQTVLHNVKAFDLLGFADAIPAIEEADDGPEQPEHPELTRENKPRAQMATICTPSWCRPWLVKRPFSVLKRPTASLARMPQVPCTEKASTGSSNFSESSFSELIIRESTISTKYTTRSPARKSTIQTAGMEVPSQPAVMPTSPARATGMQANQVSMREQDTAQAGRKKQRSGMQACAGDGKGGQSGGAGLPFWSQCQAPAARPPWAQAFSLVLAQTWVVTESAVG